MAPHARRLGLVVLALAAGCGGSAPPPAVTSSESGGAPGRPEPTAKNGPTPPAAIDVGGRTAPDAIFRVQVSKDGKIAIDGSRLENPSELPQRIRSSARVRPDLEVLIIGDPDVPYVHITNTIELAKQGGVTKIAFQTRSDSNAVSAPAAPASAQPVKSVPQLDSTWKCHVREDVPNLDKLSAFIAIHVGPDGVPQTVDVLDDPGHGLGESARACALQQKFRPAVDGSGKPTAGMTKLRVFFQH